MLSLIVGFKGADISEDTGGRPAAATTAADFCKKARLELMLSKVYSKLGNY
jgi:hypothetical protein